MKQLPLVVRVAFGLLLVAPIGCSGGSGPIDGGPSGSGSDAGQDASVADAPDVHDAATADAGPQLRCSDRCITARDGRCDDGEGGGIGGAICELASCAPSAESHCAQGEDCADCGLRPQPWLGNVPAGQPCHRSGDCASGICVGRFVGPVRTTTGVCAEDRERACAVICDALESCPQAGQLLGVGGSVPSDAFASVPPGAYRVSYAPGSPPSTIEHTVALTRPFYIGRTEVTQREYAALVGGNPSSHVACGLDCPVTDLTFWSMLAYANALSASEGLPECYAMPTACTGTAAAGTLDCGPDYDHALAPGLLTPYACAGYRLPTEAEWEVAHRAGTNTLYHCGSDPSCLETTANTGATTTVLPVASLAPNAWGLFDTAGNVSELTGDAFARFSGGSAVDPTRGDVPVDGEPPRYRMLRGSAAGMNGHSTWPQRDEAWYRALGGVYADAFVGFRLARTGAVLLDAEACETSCVAQFGVGAGGVSAEVRFACESCRAGGTECASSAECCGGLCSATGRCLDACLPELQTCETSADCCSSVCDPGLGRCTGCRMLGEGCESSGQCCGGVCRSDGARFCVECLDEGLSCASSAECCDGSCVDGRCGPPCITTCGARTCGNDGCGGTCGACDEGNVCRSGSCCAPVCEGLECGSDGCAGSCGECDAGESCSSGRCVASCVPSCSGRMCGSDGCGGLCGTCATGTCNASTGLCETSGGPVGCLLRRATNPTGLGHCSGEVVGWFTNECSRRIECTVCPIDGPGGSVLAGCHAVDLNGYAMTGGELSGHYWCGIASRFWGWRATCEFD